MKNNWINTKQEEDLREKRAAAASLAVVLALKAERETLHDFPLPEQVTVSAWQAVLRSKIHGRRGNVR